MIGSIVVLIICWFSAGPKDWLKEQKKRSIKYLLAPIDASLDLLQSADELLCICHFFQSLNLVQFGCLVANWVSKIFHLTRKFSANPPPVVCGSVGICLSSTEVGPTLDVVLFVVSPSFNVFLCL